MSVDSCWRQLLGTRKDPNHVLPIRSGLGTRATGLGRTVDPGTDPVCIRSDSETHLAGPRRAGTPVDGGGPPDRERAGPEDQPELGPVLRPDRPGLGTYL